MDTQTSAQTGGRSGLERFFAPRSIAVIGASANPAKIGARPLAALKTNGYQGQIYPINPNYDTIGGLPCYPSAQAVPGPIDLAIVSLPAPLVPEALRDCAQKGVAYAVVFSAGFAEAGPEGAALQREIERIVAESTLQVLGPNTAGAVFHHTAMVASFASTFMSPPVHQGSGIAFITQSGAFGVYVYNLAQQLGLVFDYYINTGNEAGLEVADFLEYLADRSEVRAVALYLEQVRDGTRFRRAAERCFRRGIPVIAVKVGRSAEARRAALSHTGALTGAEDVYDAVFRQSGVVRVDGIMELLELLDLVVKNAMPRGRRTGILTSTGGGGAWMTDLCRQAGLEVPEFVGPTREALEAVLPQFAAASNPVDLTGQMYTQRDLFRRCVAILARDPAIDALVLLSGGDPETVGVGVPETVVEASQSSDKPLLVAWVGAPDWFYRKLGAAGVPAFR
ncbi:MAG TPA: CoA-binding protein, partial [Chloroflexi bacterium]|nr:CoA-binding protein [Chloroflexota bacterium]